MTPQPDGATLTPRERQVMDLVARGRGDSSIALMLSIAPWTVKRHVRHSCEKLQAANRTVAAVRYAIAYWPPLSQQEAADLDSLSPQERRVLTLVGEGWKDAGIAEQLGISFATVRMHLSAACRKLGAPNRTMAAVQYHRSLHQDGRKC